MIEFQDSQGYTKTPGLEKPKTNEPNKRTSLIEVLHVLSNFYYMNATGSRDNPAGNQSAKPTRDVQGLLLGLVSSLLLSRPNPGPGGHAHVFLYFVL